MPLNKNDLLDIKLEAESAAIHNRMTKLTSDQVRGLLKMVDESRR